MWWHTRRHSIRRHAIRRRIVATSVHIWHHFTSRSWRHRVAMVPTTAVTMLSSMWPVSSVPSMSTMPVKVAIGTTACSWRGKRIRSSRGKRVLAVPIRLRTAKGHQLVGGRRWTSLKWIVPWIRHHARSISTGRGLVGNVRPLSAWMVRRLTRPGRIARVVVVAVQTVRVVGLRPSPTRPVSGVQRVSALRSVARRRIVDGWVV